jgi:hypothetical protein
MNDIARCDGLLWKLCNINGQARRAYFTDCPLRTYCTRFQLHAKAHREGDRTPVTYVDSPQAGTACGHYIETKTVTEN